MADRWIEASKPQYHPSMMVPADVAYWEVLYQDGSVLCEAAGALYPQIDRSRLRAFRIVHNGEIAFEAMPPPGRSGHNLFYRRVTQLGDAARAVNFVVGWAPMGPFYVIDLEHGSFWEEPPERAMRNASRMNGETDDLFQPVPV